MDVTAPDNQTSLIWNHYLPMPEGQPNPTGMRRFAHTDMELMTLLFQRPGQPPTVFHKRAVHSAALTCHHLMLHSCGID